MLSVVVLRTYSQIYPGPCALHIFNHQLTRQSDLSTLFFLRLSERPFSGLVARRILLLYVVPDVYHRWLLPIGFLYFYYVYSKHLVYLLALASQPCPIWAVSRDPLWGSFNVFCPIELLEFRRLDSSEVSALVASFLFSAHLVFFPGS